MEARCVGASKNGDICLLCTYKTSKCRVRQKWKQARLGASKEIAMLAYYVLTRQVSMGFDSNGSLLCLGQGKNCDLTQIANCINCNFNQYTTTYWLEDLDKLRFLSLLCFSLTKHTMSNIFNLNFQLLEGLLLTYRRLYVQRGLHNVYCTILTLILLVTITANTK